MKVLRIILKKLREMLALLKMLDTEFRNINPIDGGGKFRSCVFATDRWNSLEQCNPYISISDNLFRRIFDESGIRRRYIEKKSFFGRNLRSIRLWILWYFCGEYTFYKLVSDHIWMNYHKI